MKLCRIKGEDKKIMKQLYRLSLPEAFLQEDNTVRSALNKIGERIDSLRWSETKLYLFIGTIMTIKEFEESLPPEYYLSDDYSIVSKTEKEEVSLSEYMIEYKNASGRGGRR